MNYVINKFNESAYSLVLTILLWYYCLYDFTSIHSLIPTVLSNLIVLVALGFSLLYVLYRSGGIVVNHFSLPWIPFVIVLLFHIFNYRFEKSYVILMMVFVVLTAVPIHISSYEKILKWFKYIAIFGAIGVVIQLLMPNFHHTLMSFILSNEGISYIDGYAKRGYYSGFFHQVGDTAFYVSAGIITILFSKTKKRIDYFLVIWFLISLVILGKRSLLLFLIGALLLTYILNSSRNQLLRRYSVFLLAAITLFFILKALTQTFGDVIFFQKMAYTMAYIEVGDLDGLMEESGRLNLSELAKNLFEQNQLFGIGWAQFSIKSEELYASGFGTSVHNIYLQLLCETGYVGFFAFLLGVSSSLYQTFKVRLNLKKKGWRPTTYLGRMWSISFTGQILFLTVGFVENPLYNANCLLFYMFVVLLNIAISNELNCIRKPCFENKCK